MTRLTSIRPEFVRYIPSKLEPGVLYVSREYRTASHLCCCGCGNKVVTPLNPSGWQITEVQGAVTLYPSIGSWALACRSHYWIRRNQIEWAAQWTKKQIAMGRKNDQRAQEAHFGPSVGAPSIWQQIVSWIRSLFS